MYGAIQLILAAFLLLGSLVSSVQGAQDVKAIKVPQETVLLKPSGLVGYALASQACSTCHSADYIAYQPPGMTKAQWTAEAAKMQHAYGAPINDEQVSLVGIYLAAVYGDARSVTDEDRQRKPVAANGNDPVALLNANGCLACHQINVKVVGPAYHDVAVKYRAEPKAAALLAQSIRMGSAGKWGATPMPPFAGLSDEQLDTLAKFILQQ